MRFVNACACFFGRTADGAADLLPTARDAGSLKSSSSSSLSSESWEMNSFPLLALTVRLFGDFFSGAAVFAFFFAEVGLFSFPFATLEAALGN